MAAKFSRSPLLVIHCPTSFNPRNLESLKNQYTQAKALAVSKISRINKSDRKGKSSLYIPILRGLRPINYEDKEFTFVDSYLERTLIDYFPQKNGRTVPRNEVYTGATIYDDVMSLLLGNESNRQIIFDFESFLGKYIFKSKVTLIPKYKDKVLTIKIGHEKQLEIFNLGDGVQSIISILFPIFRNREKRQVVFIEEPEMHLHVHWQRLLVNALKSFELNQYFISTHSSSFIGIDESQIFSITREKRNTIVSLSMLDSSKRGIIANLGYKPQDILQANFILWVEGPSDRIYINSWIKKIDNSLEEGRDYSILFFGGETYRHYLVSGDIVNLSMLQDINQHFGIVLDSDRSRSNEPYADIKKKIKQEFQLKGGFCWLTKAREIENYIPTAVFVNAIQQVHDVDVSGVIDESLYAKRTTITVDADADAGVKPKIKISDDVFQKIQVNQSSGNDLLHGVSKKDLFDSVRGALKQTQRKKFNIYKMRVAEYIEGVEYSIEDREWKTSMDKLIKAIKK